MTFGNTVYIAVELSVSSWLVAARLPGVERQRQQRLEGGDTVALLALIAELRSLASRSWAGPQRWRAASRRAGMGFGCTDY